MAHEGGGGGQLEESGVEDFAGGEAEGKSALQHDIIVSQATLGFTGNVLPGAWQEASAQEHAMNAKGAHDGQNRTISATFLGKEENFNEPERTTVRSEKLTMETSVLVNVESTGVAISVDGGQGVVNLLQGRETAAAVVVKRGRKKRKQPENVVPPSLEVEEHGAGWRSKRPSRQHAKVSTYDESALDKLMEEHLEGTSFGEGKRKSENVEKDITMEAMIAAAIGFPCEALTEEEIEAGVVSIVGSLEQANYIVVRNHILKRWRENVSAWLDKETVMDSIRRAHSKLVESAYKFLLSHGYINYGVAPAIKSKIPAEKDKASVIVIGAGLSGLAAARHLMATGHKVIVVEGRQRAGGRVYTKKMEVEGTWAAADLGGSVVTGMHGNPLGVLARQMNLPLHKIRDDCPIFQPNGQPAVEEVDKKVEAQFNELLDTCSKWREEMDHEGVSLGGTLESLRQSTGVGVNPAERQLYDWHSANLEYANAALLTNLSLSYWDQDDPYEMGGDHCFLPGGNIQFITALTTDVPIFYGKTVHAISYGGEGVQVITADQVFEAEMVLCTVPLGVLKKGIINFQPPLPQRKLDAIGRLGFGLLNKVVMLFPKVFWGTDIDTFGHLEENPKKRGEFFMFYSYAAVSGGPLLMALVAGEAAIEFERTPPLEAVTRVMSILKGIFEPRGIRVPNPVQTVCTRWGSDSLCYGSYSNVAVGASGDDYDILAESVGGKLFFAGEATNRKYPATMHGALLSGHREAANMARAAATRPDKSKIDQSPPRNTQPYSETLVELFREPDLELGPISVIFNHQVLDPASLALVRVVYNVPKESGPVTSENTSRSDAVEQLHLYTTITRQQAFELKEVNGDKERFVYLCQKFGVKLVGRKGLGPAGDALVVAIKWDREARKANTIVPASFENLSR